MEDDGEEVAYMSEEELRKVYRKLFAMRPYMTIEVLMDLLHRNNWNETKCMAELYRLREGIEEDRHTKNVPIDPVTESPARPNKVKKTKTSQEPIRQSPRRKSMSRGALYAANSSNGRARPRVSSSSPETEDGDTPRPSGIILGDEDRHASKRQKLTSSKTSMFSREQTNTADIDYDAKFQVIDDREVRKAMQREKVEESDEEGKEKRHVAQIAEHTKKANHTTVTPWIGRLAGGLYVKTLLVTEEFDNALKDRDGVVAEMKNKGELKSIIDMTVNREKLWKEGWNGKHITSEVEFLGESTWENGSRTGYGAVEIDGQVLLIGDCVVIRPGEDEAAKNLKKKRADGEAAAQIWFGKIMSMFHDSSVRDEVDQKQAHVRWFNHGGDSFLSETAGPRELFLLSRCDNIPLTTVAGKVQIDKITTVGPVETDRKFHEVNHYFYRFHDDEKESFPHCWEDASFHEDDPDSIVKFDGEQEPCYSCNKKAQAVADSLARTATDNATSEINKLWWGGKQYRLGDFVYVQPTDLMKPFMIGRLKTIIPAPVRSKVRRFDGELMIEGAYDIEVLSFRRHKEFGGDYFKDALSYKQHKQRDERRLYQSPKVIKYDVERLIGKCNVVHGQRVDDLEAYKQLADTFYVLDKVPDVAQDGSSNDGKYREDLLQPLDKSEFEDSCDANKMVSDDNARRGEFAKAGRKLLAMDVFAGCGGLTHGLDAGGAVETRWAVEWDVEAAATFKKNFPQAIMYNEDVNKLLHQARKEELGLKTRRLRDRNGKMMLRMPKRGQVDFLYGGPPCQDFSGANRFRKANSIKNSLLTVYLSLLDHYQPGHFMLENVKDLLYHRLGSSQTSKHRVSGGIEQGSVKFILRALTSLGYSAQYNMLQAAEHGSPQSRRRVFFMGSKLGIRLPLYPQPTHVCNTVATHTRSKGNSAPHGPVTIGDAISDLPQFDWGVVIPEDDREWLKERAKHVKQAKYPLDRAALVGRTLQPYGQAPLSNYQAWLRSGQPLDAQVRNHYTPHYQEANLLRVLGVPMEPLANWRDAPQEYIAEGLKRRGAVMNRYDNRYRRLHAALAFQTCMTNMDPSHMSVIHPYNRRTLSVRELARAQGFPDWFVWEDGLDEQGRKKGGARGQPMKPKSCIKQIGNAVSGCHSLPLGKAIFEVEYERWVQEGKPQMEPRKLVLELEAGQCVVLTDSEDDSIFDGSGDGFSDTDDFEAKDESEPDDELAVDVGHRKVGRRESKPTILLGKKGGNEVIVISDSETSTKPPPRRAQGTFVNGHGRPGLGSRRAASKKIVTKTYDERDGFTTDEFSEDKMVVDNESESLFVEQGIGAPPHDEMDDEEFERWLVMDGGKFEDMEEATKGRRMAEIARLERGSGTPLGADVGGSHYGSAALGGAKKVQEVKKRLARLGAFIDTDSDSDEMVVDVGVRKVSSPSRGSASKLVINEKDTIVVDSVAKTVSSSGGSGTKKVPVVKLSSFSHAADASEDEDDVPVVDSLPRAPMSPSTSTEVASVQVPVVKLPVFAPSDNTSDAEIEVEGDRDADVGALNEPSSDLASALIETAFSDAMQGVEADVEGEAEMEVEEEIDENLKFKLASWGEAIA